MMIASPPLEFMAAVAGEPVTADSHHAIGQSLFETVRKVCRVKPTDAILDIGSGCGRVAVPLTGFLDRGTYDGVDIVLPMVKWCQQNITPGFPNFRFHHADLKNTLYSDAGQDAAGYTFPFKDASFDVIFATSVFTHLVPKSAFRYAQEIARVLRPTTGRALLTFYLTHDDYRARVSRGETLAATFPHQLDGYSVSRLDNPEAVTAYEEAGAAKMLRDAGLSVDSISRGWWSGNKSGWTHQDGLLVSARPY